MLPSSRAAQRLPVLALLLLVAVLPIAVVTQSTGVLCYTPNGNVMDSTYEPCNGSAPVSMCCHLGVSNNGGDACGSGSQYGLCGVTGTQLWRESCTDPKWEAPECLALCLYGDGGMGDVKITACDDGSYCCGANNATCCDGDDGVFIVNNEVTNSPPKSGSASTTGYPAKTTSQHTPASHSTDSASHSTDSTSTKTSPSAAAATTNVQTSATPTSQPDSDTDSSGLSSGAKIGLGVGIALGIVLVAAIGLFLFWRRRQQRLSQPIDVPRHEVEAKEPVREIDGGIDTYYAPKATHANSELVEMP